MIIGETKIYAVPGSPHRVAMRKLGGGRFVSCVIRRGDSTDEKVAWIVKLEADWNAELAIGQGGQ